MQPGDRAYDAQEYQDRLRSEHAAKPFFERWKHVGVCLGFYPLDWNIRPTWGPVAYTINLGPFALTFIF